MAHWISLASTAPGVMVETNASTDSPPAHCAPAPHTVAPLAPSPDTGHTFGLPSGWLDLPLTVVPGVQAPPLVIEPEIGWTTSSGECW